MPNPKFQTSNKEFCTENVFGQVICVFFKNVLFVLHVSKRVVNAKWSFQPKLPR